MRYYGYNEFLVDMKQLVNVLDFEPDGIVAIARGGMSIAHVLGIALDINEVYLINAISYSDYQKEVLKISNPPSLEGRKDILIVDDIVDSGESMQRVCQILQDMNPDIHFKTASIFYKPEAIFKPDYYIHQTHGWIEFFWEVDVLKD
ncbi:nicotinate phosphoribosyltransferase [Helicobacter monodelphidis]|uniref:phosphoribosyltransferase n=1 Tax=Helicobacter sp. 15-1451 TaxID=2004995 RepID=UPI000DCF2066|nr:phosphoribosyltransferase family protein [Helicobacter sp. 15-1451]RAX58824.1 nicotinate phosphoribosyltransferase [Helicobacter sp. 15-1451]